MAAPLPATLFDAVFDILESYEGAGLDLTRSDSGNWTGGAVGVGRLGGSRWGLSSAQYPTIDLKWITRDAAKDIYREDYWTPVAGDALPPPLALLVFDAAVNSGTPRAVRWLQATIGVTQDGFLGPVTLAAARAAMAANTRSVLARYLATRMRFLAGLASWPLDGGGWSERLADLPFRCFALPPSP